MAIRYECVVSFTPSLDDDLMRKRIHAMNWRYVSNKALALIMLRHAYRKRHHSKLSEGGGKKRRCKSDGSIPSIRPVVAVDERKRSV